ncbi:hypothetical protein BFP72_08015 [Reichenbachiella sp. 5M10]|uniref:RNA-binding domain-containing protein n=1 Tax=Reichenbachiella sp. 5M10 TaxID=1889772 RepID=UPI000C158813|nr:RNA-binding domain-containing protein [Reichenbachiella sp. 5M10]PIB35344.1 hypothetical protein BFP72_08015 [Reichenbachiella sp. 5M10]
MKPRFRKLFLNLSLLIVVVVGSLLGFVMVSVQEARTELAKEAIQQLSERSLEHFTAFYTPIEHIAAVLKDWGKEEILLIDEPKRLSAQLIPLLRENPALSGLSIADQHGYSYYVYQEQNSWVFRYHLIDQNEFKWIRLDSAGQEVDTWQDTLSYDPRTRLWFEEGLKHLHRKKPIWTEAYSFHHTQRWGVSGVVSWTDSEGDTVVAAVDIPLQELFTTISKFGENQKSEVFLFNDQEEVFDPERAPQFFVASSELDEYFQKVLGAWNDSIDYQSQSFDWSGSKYWVGLQPLHITQHSIWLASFSKEDNFFSVLESNFPTVGSVSALIILLGIMGAYALVYRARPKNRTIELDMQNFEASAKAFIAKGEGSQIEFKSTVRMNLHSNNPGKEIELAWLKGVVAFLNSQGGVLFMGVNDEGEVIGLSADRFPSVDKCLLHVKNLIKEHIGPSYFQFIDFGMKPIDGQEVVYVQVRPASAAAYLKPKVGEEVFYIRSGPASEKLPVSKVVEYLRRRKMVKL